jgi:hypothetical protein
MSADSNHPNFRGVHCRSCGKPVRVPALVMKNESATHAQGSQDSMQYHLISQVFVLRCHSCRKESVYSINQIVDCAFVPTSVRGGAKEAAA